MLVSLLNDVVRRETGSTFDFASQYAFDTSSKAWGEYTRTADTYAVAQRASDAVKSWLEKILGAYEQIQREVAAGGKPGASAEDREKARQGKAIIERA